MKKIKESSKRGSTKTKPLKPTPISLNKLSTPVETPYHGKVSEEIASDMLFVRDNLVMSIDTEKSFSASEVIDYVDQGINGVLRVIEKGIEPWSSTIDICQYYFDKINN